MKVIILEKTCNRYEGGLGRRKKTKGAEQGPSAAVLSTRDSEISAPGGSSSLFHIHPKTVGSCKSALEMRAMWQLQSKADKVGLENRVLTWDASACLRI